MKEGESHILNKQSLQQRADKLLPSITHKLTQLGYQAIAHQRISQQDSETSIYQGLTRATHSQFGQVMVKWQVNTDHSSNLTSLQHEIAVLIALNNLQNMQAPTMAPLLLAFKNLHLKVLAQEQLLTLLVMPYYWHGSLAKYLKQPLTHEQKHQFIVQSAQLLANLHRSGWLHNDIKPSNILMSPDYGLLLTDFALAQPIETNNNHRNNSGNNAGTPAYLAPERWQGQGATLQSDIYAFGIMLYEILLGKRPFIIDSAKSASLQQWAMQHCQQPVAKLPKQYQCYQTIINKALAKQLQNRYQSTQQLVTDLQTLNVG